MDIICINTRDELNLIDLDLVACIKADGNYSTILYIEGNKLTVSLGLSQLEEILKNSKRIEGLGNPFMRLGRSVIVNNRYLSQINTQKQRITLSDRGTHAYQLALPKPLLKKYKDLIRSQFNIQVNEDV